jgi:putative hydrolase of the HAD superfamily
VPPDIPLHEPFDEEPAIRAVVFDFFGTVACRSDADGSGLAEAFERHGYRLTPKAESEYLARYDGIEHLEHSTDQTTYEAWVRFRYTALARECGVDARAVDPLVDSLLAMEEISPVVAYPDAVPTLTELRERGVRVAICSNWGWDLERSLSDSGLLHLVDLAITSARAGARKPHPRIYEVVAERIGVSSEATLFVGDSVGPDVHGPIQAGMRAAHIWRRQGAAPELPDGARRLGSLTELLDWPSLHPSPGPSSTPLGSAEPAEQ